MHWEEKRIVRQLLLMQDCYIHWAIQYGVVVTRMQHLNGGPARKGGGGHV